MALNLKTAATSYPITRDEAKAHLRVTFTDDDTYIDGLIAVATDRVQRILNRSLMNEVWQLTLDQFPCGPIELPQGKTVSVASITYTDVNGGSQTVSSSTYTVDVYSDPGRVLLNYGESWPTARGFDNAVVIEYTAGYSNGDSPETFDVPDSIKHAIKLVIAQMYEMREPVIAGVSVAEVPLSVEWLLSPYKIHYA